MNCGQELNGKYCSHCGQKDYTDKDKSFSAILHEVLHFLTHYEHSVFATIKTIFSKPGQYALDYCNGIRKRYFKPVTLFLVLVVLYLLFPLLQGLNVGLNAFHSKNPQQSVYERQIQHAMKKKGISYESLKEKYHHVSEKTSKFLLLILIPMTALLLYALHFKSGKYAFDYFILATELNIFFLMAFYLILPGILALVQLATIKFQLTEPVLVTFVLLAFTAFVFLAFRRFFKGSAGINLLKSALFSVAHLLVIVTVYRLILFWISIWLV